MNEVNTFLWNELATHDLEAAQTFYTELLGWEFDETGFYRLADAGEIASASKYQMIKASGRPNGAIIEMTDVDRWGATPPHWSVYFRVSDVDAFVTRAEDLGGRARTFDVPIARMAVVADAQGAVFNVVQYERKEQGSRIKYRKRKR